MKDQEIQEKYNLKEFASRGLRGFRNLTAHVSKIPGLIKRFRHRGCYASIMRFPQALADQVRDKGSVARYRGSAWAPFLVLDIDHGCLDRAIQATRWIYLALIEDLKVARECVFVWFSGMKGVHIFVDMRAGGGLEPSNDAHSVMHEVRVLLVEFTNADRECFDESVKDITRIFRLPGTKHEKSGLWKTRLTERELLGMQADEIRLLAREPRVLDDFDGNGGLVPTRANVPVSEKFQRLLRAAENNVRAMSCACCPSVVERGSLPVVTGRGLCEAERNLFEEGVGEGARNNTAIRLAARFRGSGVDEDQARRLLLGWNLQKGIGLDEREIARVISSAYRSGTGYSYGCNDPILVEHCPFKGNRDHCEQYRRFRVLSRTG